MTEKPELSTAVAQPRGSKVLRAFGDEVTVLFDSQATGGQFTAFHDVTPPGGGPPPHRHANEDEWFFPLEGEAEYFLDGEWVKAEVGSMVFAPRGSVHTFRNVGDGPLRQLIHTAPSGFEVYFERCAEVFAEPGPPDMARILEISAEHGISFVDPPGDDEG